MTIPAHIVHQTDGRIRIKIPSRRGDSQFFSSLSEQMMQLEQVERARGNAAAASLAVEYGGAVQPVHARFEQCGLELNASEVRDAGVNNKFFIDAIQASSAQIKPMMLAGAAFALVGVVQTARGEIMLPALSAFWYAASAWRLAHLPASGHSAELAVQQSNVTLP
jgi:hypothetical protein